jgi:hypothetical protein
VRPDTLYRWLLRKHIAPHIGGVELGKLSPAGVRQWRSDRIVAGVSESVTAKSYRPLRAILNTAVDPDRIIARNPCKVPGADREHPAERPVITVAQVFALAEEMPARFRAMVLLTAFASLRFGESRPSVAATWRRMQAGSVSRAGSWRYPAWACSKVRRSRWPGFEL